LGLTNLDSGEAQIQGAFMRIVILARYLLHADVGRQPTCWTPTHAIHAKQRQHLGGKVTRRSQAPNFGYLGTDILLNPPHKKFRKKDLAAISRTCQ
jgi:hypothetical protein